MARSSIAVEVNKFNAGLITDRSPLTSQDNSSLDEENFVLNVDGSRNRRLGMDFETNYTEITTTVGGGGSVDIASTTYRWGNAGGNPEKSILVVQFGTELKFFDLDTIPVSGNLIFTYNFSSAVDTQIFSFTVVDGILIVATNTVDINSFEYDGVSVITATQTRLKIRDLFGLQDEIASVDLTSTINVSERPSTTTDAHIYNLRNQSFGVPRIEANMENLVDPITSFRSAASNTSNLYPSNSDNVVQSMYNDANDTDDRISVRFFPQDLFKNPIGSGRTAEGYFIIDALTRGVSRQTENNNNLARYSQLTHTITNVPVDTTPGGASVIAEFAGRAWYSGFAGDVTGGDDKSPRMSSYVLYSKVVNSPTDIYQCYQENDPTSRSFPDILDTDGGFIRVNGAYGIIGLVNVGASLMVIAKNGIWRIFGGTDSGFTATNYIVQKITDQGGVSPNSVVVIDNTFMYWSNDGVYHVRPKDGGWISQNLVYGRIQSLYNNINLENKVKADGSYDSYERKIRWIYNNRTSDTVETKELVLDLTLQAFYLNSIRRLSGISLPKVSSIYTSNPFKISSAETQIVAAGVDVVIGVDNVVVNLSSRAGSTSRELAYIAITQLSPVIKYTMASYNDVSFLDWFSSNSIGIDANAYMVTSYLSGTDFQRDKQINYITVHCRRTEDGFDNTTGDIIPTNQSSCLIRSMWEWADSSNSNKWGRQFQAYRYKRLYVPTGVDDPFDSGFSTIVTKNKLRGNGRVLSIKWETEPARNLHLYGWSMMFNSSKDV